MNEVRLMKGNEAIAEAAIRAGYGPTIRSDAVKKLVDSITNFQEKTYGIVTEMPFDFVAEVTWRFGRVMARSNA